MDAAHNPGHLSGRLTMLARKGQLAAGHRSLWSMNQKPFRPPAYVPRRALLANVSQLHHGELLTARLCVALAGRVALSEARACLSVQRDDEIAHAGLYADYLADLGGIAPRHQVLDLLETAIGQWTGAPEAVILAVHVLLEGEAAGIQRTTDVWLPCPRFGAINRLVARDEARHIAFGRLYLPHALAALPRRERAVIYGWLRDLWWRVVRQIHGALGAAGIVSAPAFSIWARRRWRHWQGELQRLCLYCTAEASAFEQG